jgi:hypothetical protein
VQTENVASSRDRHLNPTPTRNSTPLPTNDDWVFRVKVISSTKDLDNEVFRKAVQGLVKICFPSGVLEELGIDVLKQHMQEENAPAENIAKMTEVFRSEMIQRVAYMLAAYLDTPAKVGAGVRSVIEASAEMHSQLRDDLRNVVKASLDHQQSIADDEFEDNAEHFTDVEPSPPPSPKHKQSKATKEGRKAREQDHDVDGSGSDMNIDVPTHSVGDILPTSNAKTNTNNKKISTSWRWDIDSKTPSTEVTLAIFKRPSDLYAYHALPIARGRVGAHAKRKEVRQEMQTMLDEMLEEEYHKWIDSFQKLHDGDMEMLKRIESEPTPDSRRRTAATPAPIDARKRAAGDTSKSQRKTIHGATQDEAVRISAHDGTRIKREAQADSYVTEETQQEPPVPHNDGVAKAITAFRPLFIEELDGDLSAHGRQPKSREGFQNPVRQEVISKALNTNRPSVEGIEDLKSQPETPIVDMLWGATGFVDEERKSVANIIIVNLRQRIAVEVSEGSTTSLLAANLLQSVAIQKFEGTIVMQTIADLKVALLRVSPPRGGRFYDYKVRTVMEYKLTPWAIANLASFSEFKSHNFIFVNMMPVSLWYSRGLGS